MSLSMIPKDLLPIIGNYVFPSADDYCKLLSDDNSKYMCDLVIKQ